MIPFYYIQLNSLTRTESPFLISVAVGTNIVVYPAGWQLPPHVVSHWVPKRGGHTYLREAQSRAARERRPREARSDCWTETDHGEDSRE